MGALLNVLVGVIWLHAGVTASPFDGNPMNPLYSEIDKNIPPQLNNRLLVDLAVPSVIKDLIIKQNDETFVDRLFQGINENCSSHVLEWIYRMNHLEEFDLGNASNTWPLQMVDSWGKVPEGILGGHLNSFGEYDECINLKVENLVTSHRKFPEANATNFGGRYCMTYLSDANTTWNAVGLQPPTKSVYQLGENVKTIEARKTYSLQDFQNYFTKTTGLLRPRPSVGTCMPSSCSRGDIHRLFLNALNMTYSDANLDRATMPWAAAAICREKKESGLDRSAIGVICLISFMGALALSTGIYDYWLTHCTEGKRPKSPILKYLMAFSLYTNTRKWLSTRKSADDFGCLHGIRSLTTAWVVLAHTYVVNLFVPAWNGIDVINIGNNWTNFVILNGFFSVDTFLLMSGTLVCYNLLKLLDKSNGKLNLPMFYIHRYLRLTPTYAILVAIGATLLTYLGDGPYWYFMEQQEKHCKDNWWTNLLYINNVVKTDKMCNGESWYLANDMQFYVLSPLMIYPIWKSEKIGLALTFLYFVASCFSVPILVNYHGTPPTVIANREMYYNTWQSMIYIRPYARIGVFIVGIWLGWLLYKTKGKRVNIPKIAVILGWALSTAAALYVIFCIAPWYDLDYKIPKAYGYFYAGLCRPIWGFAVGWVIFACVKGYGGLINRFLSWSVFMPLGRLTFCVYLTSYHFQQMYIMRARQPPLFDTYNLVNLFFAHFFLSCLVGCLCTLIFESPFMIIQRLIFEGDRSKTSEVKNTQLTNPDPIQVKTE